MFRLKDKFRLQSIRTKVVLTFLFGCAVALLSWLTANYVFDETFATIDIIASPNPRLRLAGRISHQIHRLDRAQKQHLLQPGQKSYDVYRRQVNRLFGLLDSLGAGLSDSLQLARIARMKTILRERETMFSNYLRLRSESSLSDDMHRLSEYIEQNDQRSDSVPRLLQRTTTTTVVAVEDQRAEKKKESLFRRIFGRKKRKQAPAAPRHKTVTEEVQLTIDTLALNRRDSFLHDMKAALQAVEHHQTRKGRLLTNHELKLSAATGVFMDELQQLLQQVQQEEIRTIEDTTESLGVVFNNAFSRLGYILAAFFFISLIVVFLIFSDISRSNRMRLQLIEEREKAEQLEQAKHRFLANMSHEIRTPLQSIIGYAEQLKLSENSDVAATIYASSRHLLQIVNEVLDYSRIVSGHFAFEKQDFNMAELLAEICDTLLPQAEAKAIGFRLKTDIVSEMWHSGDPFRLRQVLYNLLGNAIKFTQHGEVLLTVTAAQPRPGLTQFRFEIKDTGIGMTPAEMKTIFNSFEQGGTDTQRLYGGTGLGLSIAKTLTELQGGSLELSSEKGRGSVFSLVMGYRQSKHEQPAADLRLENRPVEFHGRVLVVDDDPYILKLLELLFKKHNVRFTATASALQAAELHPDKDIQLVLLDQRMPGLTGVELLARLKHKLGASARFIALTAHALPDERESLLRQGFDDVLLKPFVEADVLKLLADQMDVTTAAVQPVDRFSLDAVRRLCGDDPVAFAQTLRLFYQQSAEDLELFYQASRKNDPQVVAESAHRLSARIAQLGMNNCAALLRITEQKGRQGNLPSTEIINDLLRTLNDVLQLIKKEIASQSDQASMP